MACKPYSKQDLLDAVQEVKLGGEGVTLRRTALKYNIPVTTLHDHVHGKSTKIGVGGPTVMTPREEQEIVLTCQVLADMGFGLTKELIEVVVLDYIKENNIKVPSFTGGIPGKDWWQRFFKRWPTLANRKPQHLSKHRAKAANPAIVEAWFDKVEAF